MRRKKIRSSVRICFRTVRLTFCRKRQYNEKNL